MIATGNIEKNRIHLLHFGLETAFDIFMLNTLHTFSMFCIRVIHRHRNYSSISGMTYGAFCFVIFPLALTGCAIKRNSYDVPQIALPEKYKNSMPNTALATKDSKGLLVTPNAQQEVGLTDWWRSFGNTELVELVERGIVNNSDVRIATLRMAQAKSRADQAYAGSGPTINAPIGAAIGSIPVGTSAAGSTTQKSYQASIQGSWRMDVWGEQSSLAEAAKFQQWVAAYNRDNVQRNLAAYLASSYVEFLSLNDRLRVARETETTLSNMLSTVEKRVDIGDATLIDLEQEKAVIYSARVTIPLLEQQRESSLTNIAFLVGTVPGTLKLSSDGLDALYFPDVIPALPSSLLLRRPDVRMAEAQLLSADADIDVARARMLPPLDLSSQVGYSSLSISQLFQPSTLFWNGIANMTASIFDGGKLASEKENSQAIHEEMVEAYARTIYQAVREVEDALVAIRMNGRRLDEQQEVIASAQRALKSSAEAYSAGGIDYMALLDAERSYQRYLDEYLRVKMEHYHAYISLFQALGGGVKAGGQLPGKGVRPTMAKNDNIDSVSLAVSKIASETGGIDWVAQPSADNFWQVELPGMYHRSTIAAVWRDLRTRYPKLMGNMAVRPRLRGRIEGSTDDQTSWYRLYVGKFATSEAAHELCAALQENFQRCQVTSSHSDETVAAPQLTKRKEGSASKSNQNVLHGTDMSPTDKPSSPAMLSKATERVAGEPYIESDPALLAGKISSKDK
jgi:NodT family efflux transporter outer membrane factor (OMF) lipoprotein